MTHKIPSLAQLGLSRKTIVLLGRAWVTGDPLDIETALNEANRDIRGRGVKALYRYSRVHPSLYYIDREDPYAITLYWDLGRRFFFIGSWAEWIDKQRKREQGA